MFLRLSRLETRTGEGSGFAVDEMRLLTYRGHSQVRFQGEADVEPKAKLAASVEIDMVDGGRSPGSELR